MPYTVTEPHPTVPQNAYTHSGRGGLGNTFRAPATTPPSGVPTSSLTKVVSGSSSLASAAHATTRFYSGRGGAGNVFSSKKWAMPSSRKSSTDRKGSDASSASGSSEGGARSGFWGRLRG